MKNIKTNPNRTDKIISVKNSGWFPLIIFTIGTFVISLASYYIGGNITIINENTEIGILSASMQLIFWIVAISLIAISTYIQWLSHKTRPIVEVRENLITLYIHLGVLFFFPLAFFRLNSNIAGCIILGISIIVGIYLVYRYYNSSIIAGILSTIYLLWIMYVFYIVFAITIII